MIRSRSQDRDWARAGPDWSQFKQKRANFSPNSKPAAVRDFNIFHTARVFETQDFYNWFIAILLKSLIWTEPDWFLEPRDATNTWEHTVRDLSRFDAITVHTTEHSIELWLKCYIPLPQSHFLKNRIRFLWHFGTLSYNKPLQLTSQSYIFREIIRTKEHVFGLTLNNICTYG